MQSAGQWYQQNRRLKRRSAALLQRLPPQALQDWDTLDAIDAGMNIKIFITYILS